MHDGVVLVICISGRDGPQRLETNNLTHTQPFAGRNQSSSSRKQADPRLNEWKNGKSLYLTYPSSSCLELEVEISRALCGTCCGRMFFATSRRRGGGRGRE